LKLEEKTEAVETKYGIIEGRDALIIEGYTFELMPLCLSIRTSLDLQLCVPEHHKREYRDISFTFSNITKISIHMRDEYPDLFVESCFVKVKNIENADEYILETYDHIFWIRGNVSLVYHD